MFVAIENFEIVRYSKEHGDEEVIVLNLEGDYSPGEQETWDTPGDPESVSIISITEVLETHGPLDKNAGLGYAEDAWNGELTRAEEDDACDLMIQRVRDEYESLVVDRFLEEQEGKYDQFARY